MIAPARSRFIAGAADDARGPAKKQQWWRPDPVTGTWIPEGHEGQIDTVELREERLRSVPTASLEDRGWWSSLEDLPDRDEATPKNTKSTT
ncbi:uncharacterized protein LOC9634295 [Selaginella moellendorffii]|nr:uncharacterized protein LOC9634295 [Selaginella moellendorffii]|eukprot:XP_002965861.2 uncharacterized protein LOC9634295 [Selaginella moellendorffii]